MRGPAKEFSGIRRLCESRRFQSESGELPAGVACLKLKQPESRHPHTLAFLPSINRVPGRSLGVSGFGQSGSLEQVFGWHGIDTDSIVRAALDLID